ncbi:MAG TPA: DUF664 domain-containing protein [Nocardioides sp.]|jgi:hypothetical protein
MTSTEPRHDVKGEGPLFSAYLDFYREQLIAGVLSLSPEAQRTTLVPSGWTPIELLSHVLHMEQRWFVWAFLAEEVGERFGDWSVPDPRGVEDARWQVADHVTAEHLVERLRAIGERTRAILAAHSLDTVAPTGGRFEDDPAELRWICFHVLQEYARHAGHLDIVVELS